MVPHLQSSLGTSFLGRMTSANRESAVDSINSELMNALETSKNFFMPPT